MAVFLSASGLFVMTFIAHLIWWRLRMPRRQSAALLALFLASAICGFSVIYAGDFFPSEIPCPAFFWQSCSSAAFAWPISSCSAHWRQTAPRLR